MTEKGHQPPIEVAEALARSERRFRALTEKASELLSIVDATGTIIYESPNLTRILGYAAGELAGQSVFELVHPDDRAKALAVLKEEVGQPGATRQIEVRARAKDGSWRWLDTVSTNLLDDPAVNGLVLNSRDVTERKQSEEALAAAVRQWQTTFNSVGDSVWLLDTNSRIQMCNQAACAMFGKKESEMIGRRCWEVAHGTKQPVADCPMQRMCQSGHREDKELAIDDRWYRVTVDPVTGPKGELTGAVHIIRDITDRKRAELALRFSQFTLDHMSLAVYWVGVDGGFVEVNVGASEMLGYTRDELLRMTVHDIDMDFPVENRVRRWNEIKARGHVTFEARHRAKDGRLIPVEMSVSCLKLGETEYLCGFARDITDRKRTEEALYESKADLQMALDAAQLGPWHWNILTGEIVWSPQCMALYGLPADAVMGYERFLQAIHPDDRERVVAALQRAVDNGGEYRVEKRILLPDGSVRWTASIGHCSYDNTGRPVRMDGVTMDITARKQAEEAQRASEEYYRLLADHSEDFVTLNDTEGHRIYLSPSYCRRTGWTLEEMKSTDWRVRMHPEDLPVVERAHAANVKGESTSIEHRVLCQDGSWMWVETRCKPIFGPEGKVQQLLTWSHEITARKQVEQEMRESEAKYRSLIETTNTGYVIVDTEGRVLDANNEYVRLTGRERLEEIRGHKVTEWTASHDLQRNAEAVQRCAADGSIRNLEIDYVSPDGRIIPVEINATVLGASKPPTIISITRDITARRQVEAALRESEEQYRMLADQTDDFVSLHDTQGHNLYISPSYYRRTGWTPEDLETTSWRNRQHPEDLDKIERALAANLAGESNVIEHRILCCDGSWIWVERWAKPIIGPDGKVCQLLLHSHDITERKQAETALRESETKYRKLHESMMDAFVSVDMQGCIQESNPAYEAMLGYTADELRRLTYVELTPEKWRPIERRIVTEQILPRGFSDVYEKEYQRKDGTVLPVELRTFLIRDPDGVPAAMWAIVRDISERKRAEESLQYRLALEQLVAGVSSQLVNVLSTEVDTVINDVLANVGQLMKADRCYLFRVSEDLTVADNTHEWCAPGIHSQVADLKGVSTAEFPWLLEQLRGGEPLFIPGMADIPAEAVATRRLMETGRVESVILVPIRHAGQLVGFIGCDAVRAGRRWPDEDVRLLRTIGEILAATQVRCQAEEVLRASEQSYRRLVENLKGHHFIYRHDTQGIFTYLSEAITTVLGYTPSEFMGHYDTYLTDHFANQAVKQHTALSIQGIPQPAYEVNIRHKDGSERWLQVQEVPVFDPSGKVIAVEGVAQDITARKYAEAALQESEARYRALFEEAADAIVVFDPETLVIHDFNDEACRRLGYTREEFARISIPDFEVIESAEDVKKHCADIVASGPGVFETKHRTKSGEVLDIEVRSNPVRLGGKIVLVAVWRDITGRKRAEKLLKKSQSLLAETEKIGKVGGWEFNIDTRKQIWTEEVYHIHEVDLTYEPTVEKGINFYTPASRPIITAAVQRTIETGEPFDLELEITTAKGNLRSVHTIGKADPEQRRIHGFFQDITERKRTAAALQESEERYRQLLESQLVGVYMVRNGKLVYANQRFAEIFGYTYEELLSADPLTPVAEEDRPLVAENIRRRLRGEIANVHYEFRGRRKDGTIINVEAHGGISLVDGQPTIVGALQDITARKQAEAVLKRSQEELEQLVTLRTLELAGANEALKNEMNQRRKLEQQILQISEHEQRRIGQDLHDGIGQQLVALQYLSWLLSDRLTAKKSDGLSQAKRISTELEKLVEDVRKVSHGLHPVRAEPEGLVVALTELAASVTKLFKVQCRFESRQRVLLANEMAATNLYRIAQEAVNNAVRHAKAEKIVIKLERLDGGICLSVRDNGKGLPPPAKQGKGLGLQIMQYRASLIGATFEITKAKSGGTLARCSWKSPS